MTEDDRFRPVPDRRGLAVEQSDQRRPGCGAGEVLEDLDHTQRGVRPERRHCRIQRADHRRTGFDQSPLAFSAVSLEPVPSSSMSTPIPVVTAGESARSGRRGPSDLRGPPHPWHRDGVIVTSAFVGGRGGNVVPLGHDGAMTVLVDARCLRLIADIVPTDAEFCPLPVQRCQVTSSGRYGPAGPRRLNASPRPAARSRSERPDALARAPRPGALPQPLARAPRPAALPRAAGRAVPGPAAHAPPAWPLCSRAGGPAGRRPRPGRR
jgi:hypothetical protein